MSQWLIKEVKYKIYIQKITEKKALLLQKIFV